MIRSTITERTLASKDNRNLYLLEEGVISEENRGDMNDRGNSLRRAFHSRRLPEAKGGFAGEDDEAEKPAVFRQPEASVGEEFGSVCDELVLEADLLGVRHGWVDYE